MDLGISGKRAVVCAASKGLGRGCAMALAEAGVDLVINARGAEALEETAAAIRAAHGVEVTAVAGDITSEEGRAKVLEAAARPISWSTMPAARRRGCGRTGRARISSRRSTATC